MERSPFLKPIATANAIFTLVQSVTWFVLSIICFMYYSEAVTVTTVESTYKNALETWIYRLYLRKNDYDIGNSLNAKLLNITPEEFIVFSAFYFILSIVLINTSLVVIYSFRNVKDKQIHFWQYCTIVIWILAGLCQTLLDLIFFCLLLDDYNYFANQQFSIPHMGIIPTAIGVVMTIVARGFILWIINLILNVATMLIVIQEYQKDKDLKKAMFPPLERRGTLRRSTMMSEERRPYPSDMAGVMTGRSNDSFISDRYDQFPTQASSVPQAGHRPPIVARFNPPGAPADMRRYDDRFDNGYASDQSRTPGPAYSGAGGLRRSGSGYYGGR